MKYYAVIVAGGSGNRMQTETPKQFLLLKNLPVLMHTIRAFAQSDYQPQILLVLHPEQQAYWTRLCDEFKFYVPHQVIDGGQERFHSVKNAVDFIKDESIIAIHDAVRPFVSKKLIDTCFEKARLSGTAIAAVQSSDSVRLLKHEKSTALNREEIYLVQTPQTFQWALLQAAYAQRYTPQFTDDASVVEANGHAIHIVDGERNNFKITYPIDLELAELMLKA